MKSIPILLCGLLLCARAFGGESRVLNQQDQRRIAKRAIDWLLYDDWGQPDKQYKNARLTKGVASWRSWFARRNPAAVAVKVYRGDHLSERFLYTPISREITESEQVPDPPLLLSRPGPAEDAEADPYRITIHIGSCDDAGWSISIEVGKAFWIRVVEQDGDFVVRRHEDTWIFD